MPDPIRLIKKYPNRRLYDTKTSAYITLSDVKELVLSGEAFRVVDAKTGSDLTRSIMLQIIVEEEGTGAVPLLGSELLAQLIRSYGHAMQGVLGSFLGLEVRVFSELQKKIQDPLPLPIDEEHLQVQSEFLNQYLALHGQAMQSLLADGIDQNRKRIIQNPENSTHLSRSNAMPTSTSEQPVIERNHRES
ncbi:MAG: polyhydroxyalkanoate synthesis repressor PhaR [Betaproteobacteria bacterium]